MKRKPCQHCGKRPYAAIWTVRPCALGRVVKILLCWRCDVFLNSFVLRYMRHPKAKSAIAKYRKKVLG